MARFVSALVCATLAGLFYVYAEVEAVRIGYRIREQEEKRMLLLDRAHALKYNNARLKAPGNLEKKLLAQRTVLEAPRSWQTLVLPDNAQTKKPDLWRSPINRPNGFGRFFLGTAQAQAKESVRES